MFLGIGKRIKSMLMNFFCMFWALIFPLCLGILFSITIPNISYQLYRSIPVAILNSGHDQQRLLQAMSSAKINDDKGLFQVSLCTKIMADEKLNNGDIVAYIDTYNNYEIYTNSNEVQVFIVKSFLDWYQQTEGKLSLNFDMEYIMGEKTEERYNKNVLYFLSLLGGAAIYAVHWGIRIITDFEGNLSNVGKRLLLAPVSKVKIIMQNFIVALVIHIAECMILLGYFLSTGKLQCINNWYQFFLIQVLTSIIGILLGMVIGSSVKLSYLLKHRICEYLLVLLNFLAGMMFYKIRFSVNERFPVIAKLNPVNVAVDAMFQLYFVDDRSLYYKDLCILGVMIVILAGITIYITRRKIYARI